MLSLLKGISTRRSFSARSPARRPFQVHFRAHHQNASYTPADPPSRAFKSHRIVLACSSRDSGAMLGTGTPHERAMVSVQKADVRPWQVVLVVPDIKSVSVLLRSWDEARGAPAGRESNPERMARDRGCFRPTIPFIIASMEERTDLLLVSCAQAKGPTFPPWPALVLDPQDSSVPKKIRQELSNKPVDKDKEIPVYYFNDEQNVGWVVLQEVHALPLENMTLGHLKEHPAGGFGTDLLDSRAQALEDARAYVQNSETGFPGSGLVASSAVDAGYVSDPDPLVASDGPPKRVSWKTFGLFRTRVNSFLPRPPRDPGTAHRRWCRRHHPPRSKSRSQNRPCLPLPDPLTVDDLS